MLDCPRGMPRKAQISSASGRLAVPENILNLSSVRARCGLRSVLGCCTSFFSVPGAAVVAVDAVAVAMASPVVAVKTGCACRDGACVPNGSGLCKDFMEQLAVGNQQFVVSSQHSAIDIPLIAESCFSGWAARIRT